MLLEVLFQLLQNGCEEVPAVQLGDPRGLLGEQERTGVLPQGMLQGQREDQELMSHLNWWACCMRFINQLLSCTFSLHSGASPHS